MFLRILTVVLLSASLVSAADSGGPPSPPVPKAAAWTPPACLRNGDSERVDQKIDFESPTAALAIGACGGCKGGTNRAVNFQVPPDTYAATTVTTTTTATTAITTATTRPRLFARLFGPNRPRLFSGQLFSVRPVGSLFSLRASGGCAGCGK